MTLVGQSTEPVTPAQAISGVVAVLGLATTPSSSATYNDVPVTATDFGAIEAAAQAGLMADWAPTSGTFNPDAIMTRTELTVLATSAMGLQTKAASLIRDTSTLGYLRDLTEAG